MKRGTNEARNMANTGLCSLRQEFDEVRLLGSRDGEYVDDRHWAIACDDREHGSIRTRGEAARQPQLGCRLQRL